MSWVAFRKRLYFPLLFIVFGGALALISMAPSGDRSSFVIVLCFVLIVPGVIGRWLLRDLLASRALMARGEFLSALAAAERFLAEQSRRPWIRHAIWTQYGVYTLSVEAMGLNNAGAALLELKRLADSRDMLERARAADPAYPIPAYNLAVVAKLEGDEAESSRLAQEAANLGYAHGDLDTILRGIGEAYARLATPR
jgi:tetratricopeptide (TPR) repeat protein